MDINDKDIKIAVMQKTINDQNEYIVNLQVQIEKLYRENQELSKPQSE